MVHDPLNYEPVINQAFDVKQNQQVMVIESDWREPIIDYLKNNKVPEEKAEAEKLV